MQYERLITGIAAVFAVMTVALTAVGLFANPAVLFLAAMFAASTYFMYYHLSGKMAASVYERVERQAATGTRRTARGGFGAGPRDDWRPPRDGQRAAGERGGNRRQRRQRRRSRTGQQRQRVQRSRGPSTAEAYQRLDLDPSADQRAVKQAYREKVKEVHPDTETGSETEFKRVKAAYERLTDD
ncbi:J domain-containing protein [Halomicroarcula sp. GCM10025324]|uniref:J domain-containing protein n=1 Tax=Haloarcula TaxID=2237 RepID=UPI0023E8695C|nr:J domain-containing protein [Halomicroarcula sp. ZS-22-S1]